ncbi:vanillate O-demethylase oxidoreductase VanB [Mycobacterium sp. Soil538]|nr:vanillate O-demethylase oxidoreductase VanB [Mycobacterium sp. Soil538]
MTDRIEKSARLRAPLDRVWRAISDSAEFGIWFGMTVDGPFVAGATVTGVMTPTEVDDEVAASQQAFEGVSFPLHVVTVAPPRYLAFRWNPLQEPEFAELTTLVEFTLTEADDGVLLEIVESGFDALPESRRAAAFADNSGGWATQLRLIGRYVAAPQWA